MCSRLIYHISAADRIGLDGHVMLYHEVDRADKMCKEKKKISN